MRRVLIFLFGTTLLLVGAALLLLPGPGILTIVLGLAVLATEFAWARAWYRKARKKFYDLSSSVLDGFDESTRDESKPEAIERVADRKESLEKVNATPRSIERVSDQNAALERAEPQPRAIERVSGRNASLEKIDPGPLTVERATDGDESIARASTEPRPVVKHSDKVPPLGGA